MLTDLPWQLQVLVGEALLSMVVALTILETKTVYKRTPPWAVLWASSDVVCIWLMLWAGNSSIQHFLYVLMYAWATITGLVRGFRREEVDLLKTSEGREISKTFAQVFAGLMALFIIALIVTG